MKVKKTFHSLTGKFILSIGALMIVGSAVFWYFLIYYEERGFIRNAEKYGYSFADVIRKSIRYGMLTFQPHLVQQTVEAIGSAEDVMRVRVFDCNSRVAYSSKKDEKGIVLDTAKSFCMDQYPKHTEIREALSYSDKKDRNGFKVMDMTTKEHKIAMILFVFGFIIAISVVLCKILWNTVSVPISILTKGMAEIAAGNLNYTVKIDTKDEIGELAKSFNAMTVDLSKAKEKIIEWASTLEKKVNEKTEEIREAQAQLVHSEKLASLGRMAAGVAHEINSPLTGIVTFAHLLQKKFDAGKQEREDIDVIIDQANRCSNIIKGLLEFARASTADKTAVNINDILNSSLNIVRNKADFFNVKIVTNYEEQLYCVKADTSQLQQVFLNMIVNAGDAMDGKGTITVSTKNITENGGDFIEIEFRDTGSGITDKNLVKIFEPFFTPKPVGKGPGLGLAVSYGIIQEHGGNIFVKTKLGKGTSFFIKLPANKEVL